jgi:hypothetical protein
MDIIHRSVGQSGEIRHQAVSDLDCGADPDCHGSVYVAPVAAGEGTPEPGHKCRTAPRVSDFQAVVKIRIDAYHKEILTRRGLGMDAVAFWPPLDESTA